MWDLMSGLGLIHCHFQLVTSKSKVVVVVREPAIDLIKWLRPKGLNVCFHVERYAEFDPP